MNRIAIDEQKKDSSRKNNSINKTARIKTKRESINPREVEAVDLTPKIIKEQLVNCNIIYGDG